MSSDSDDLPLLGRFGANKGKAVLLDSAGFGSEGSPIPDWLSQATPVKSQVPYTISSDEDSDAPWVKGEGEGGTQDGAGAGPSQLPGTQNGGAREGPSQPAKGKAGRVGKGIRLPLAGGPIKPGANGASQDAAALAGEIPILFPAKLSTAKVIVELEGGKDNSVTDLTGDAGVVGRFFKAGSGADEEMRLDLKGVVYAVSVLPAATTMCVVNIMQTEARVETLTNSFLQLRECAHMGGDDAASLQEDHFLFDDDENYQVETGGGGDEGGAAGGKKRKRAEGSNADGAAKKRKPQARAPSAAAKKSGKAKPRAKAGAKGAKGKK